MLSAISGLLMFFVFVLILIPGIFFILTLQRTLERCSPETRTTSPTSVWYLLIPLFNIVWSFVLVIRISESLHNEFTKRNITEDPETGKKLGLAMCILGLCGVIPVIGIVASIGALVLWIMYWMKISEYSNRLSQPTESFV